MDSNKPYSLAGTPQVNEPTRTLSLAEELQGVMSADAFAVLMCLVNWGICWQDLHEGNTGMDNDKMRALMMIFQGVGPNPYAWNAMAPAIIPIICNEVEKWQMDDAYRTVNTMSWLILRETAPALARTTKGESASRKAREITARYFQPGARPDIPSLSNVLERVDQMAEREAQRPQLSPATGFPNAAPPQIPGS